MVKRKKTLRDELTRYDFSLDHDVLIMVEEQEGDIKLSAIGLPDTCNPLYLVRPGPKDNDWLIYRKVTSLGWCLPSKLISRNTAHSNIVKILKAQMQT